MIEHTKQIVEDIFEQAKNSKISFGNEFLGFWTFYVGFFTNIENKSNQTNDIFPVLKISNYKLFLKETDKYLTAAKQFYKADQDYFMLDNQSFEKKLFMDLLCNATNFDLNNFEHYVHSRTQMISSPIMPQKFYIGKFRSFFVNGSIDTCPSYLESPLKFNLIFQDESGNYFHLPSIYFGIANNSAYIYAVQRKLDKSKINQPKNPCEKKLDRLFRSVNKNVDENEYIANVSPNALISLTIFMKILKKHDIQNIIVPTFLPIRYMANINADINKKQQSEDEIIDERNRIQFNISNKLIYLMYRYCNHFDDTLACFDEARQTIELEILKNKKPNISDNLIYEIDKIAETTPTPLNQNSMSQAAYLS